MNQHFLQLGSFVKQNVKYPFDFLNFTVLAKIFSL